MVMSPFRRSVRADTKRSGGRGGKGNFYEKWRPSTEQPSAFLLINAEYTDPAPSQEELVVDPATGRAQEVRKAYFKVRKHKRAKPPGAGGRRYPESVCSAGWNPHAPQPCAGCTAMDSGDRSIGLSDFAVFGVVHLAVYHKHPLVDRRSGGYVVKQNQQQGPQQNPLLLVDDECTGRTCNYCRILQNQPIIQDPQAREPFPQYRPQDIQTFFGKRRYMELGKNHLQNLGAWDATVASICGNDGMQLITDGFKCPSCGTLLIDMSQDTRTDAQIQDAVSKPYPCMRCQKPVLLEEVVACEVCEQQNRQPKQFQLTDRVLWGQRQGESTASQLVLMRHESIQEFFQRVPQQYLGGKTVEQFLTDLAKPYEFEKLYAPKSLAEQAKELEIQTQVGPGPQQGYGGYPQQGYPPQGYQQPGQYAPAGTYAPAPQGPMQPTPPGYGGPPPMPGYPSSAPAPGGYQPAPQMAPAPGPQPQQPQQPGPQGPVPTNHPNYGR
jgi:hypothetical protein